MTESHGLLLGPPRSLKHGNRWTRRSILASIRWFYDERGRAPTAEEWKGGGPWPSYNAVRRAFGSWADAVEAAGLPRPRRGVYVVAARSGPRGPYKKRELAPPAVRRIRRELAAIEEAR